MIFSSDLKKFSFTVLLAGLAVILFSPPSRAEAPVGGHESHLSRHYTLNIDPHSAGTVGKALAKDVEDFFNEAEKAIEAKDLNLLMGLYSDGYTNGAHKKADVQLTWKRLFADFSGLAMTHNMRFITTDATSTVVIMRCSGIIVGIPTGEKELIPLDYWMNNDHVLVKEGGKLKLIGTSGDEKKRLWFDKPMHPLF